MDNTLKEFVPGKKYQIQLSRTVVHRSGVVFFPGCNVTWDGAFAEKYKAAIASAREVRNDNKQPSA